MYIFYKEWLVTKKNTWVWPTACNQTMTEEEMLPGKNKKSESWPKKRKMESRNANTKPIVGVKQITYILLLYKNVLLLYKAIHTNEEQHK